MLQSLISDIYLFISLFYVHIYYIKFVVITIFTKPYSLFKAWRESNF